MSKAFNVVVAGPESLVGEAVLALLEERDFPIGSLSLVNSDPGARIEFKGKHYKVEALDGFDFVGKDLAFFCLDEALAEEYAPKAAAAGCAVIDDSPGFRLEDDVPLVIAGVNPADLSGYSRQNIIASPGSGPNMLAIALKPIDELFGVQRADVVALQAVSGADKKGVEELAVQTTAMFNLKAIESHVFAKQIAFNLLPQVGELMDDGYSREEAKLAWEPAKILDKPSLAVNATCIRVPVFHGHSMSVTVELEQPLDWERLLSKLEATSGIELMTDDVPTPVTDAVGQDTLYMGRLRRDSSSDRRLVFWLVADNVRMSAALNCVQIAEILIKEYIY